MKTKYYFLAALASVMLASCSSDDFVAEGPTTAPEGVEGPIVFSSLKGNYTRADYAGKDAAALLNNKFVVYGYKGASTATPGTTVFDNYAVEYGVNTANTTESNTNNWEYVGVTPIKHATDNGISSQTIKYWDFSKPQYDFIAWSTGSKTAIYVDPGTIPAGSVLVSAIDPTTATDPETGLSSAFTFKGKAADLTDCYIADIVTVKKDDYNKPVTIKFRALGSKVRIGIYETIPGYSVKDVKFYNAAATATSTPTAEELNTTPKLFTTVAGDIFTEGTYTIYYPTVDGDNTREDWNQAHIKFAGTGTQKSVVEFGALNNVIREQGETSADAIYLGRSSSTASMAGEAEGNFYTAYLPNEDGTNLNLRVDYTLEAIDGGGEEIVVRGATAQVPAIYNRWKAGYAYTYLFKISDKSNGYTGVYDPSDPDFKEVGNNPDPAGLYPITFDALVVNAEEDKTQETITTVSTPSITTYQKGSNVVNNDEYLAATGDIYVTVNYGENGGGKTAMENGALQTLTSKVKLYTIPASYTEAYVVDALNYQDDDAATGTIKGRNGLVLTEAKSGENLLLKLTNKVEFGVDGNTINVSTDQAAKFTPSASTTYAFVYEQTAATKTENKFQPVTKAVDDDVEGLYHYAYKAATAGQDVQKGVFYFTKDASDNYASHTVFIGQNVSNLYTGTGADRVPASGNATGNTQYYSTTNGQTFTTLSHINYADFKDKKVYLKTGTDTYTQITDEQVAAGPQNNTTYYVMQGLSYLPGVIFPEQTDGLYILDVAAADKGFDYTVSTNKVACASGEKAIKGQVYFDKYTYNNAVYAAKVIKVQ